MHHSDKKCVLTFSQLREVKDEHEIMVVTVIDERKERQRIKEKRDR